MPLARKRTRRSFGGRWTDQERSRLWSLRNSQRMLSWELFRANYFPNRSINALQKQYSDIKQHLQSSTAMNHSEPASGNNNPVRTSERLKRPAAVPAGGQPLSKQTRTSGPDTNDSSDSEDSDSDTGDESGDWQIDGTQTELQRTPRKPVPHPDRIVTLHLAQRGNPNPPTPAAAGEQQPRVPTLSPSDPMAPPQPRRTATPPVEKQSTTLQNPNRPTPAATGEQQPRVPTLSPSDPVAPPHPRGTATPPVEKQPTTLQSPARSLNTNEKPQRDKTSPSMSPSTKAATLDRIGQWGKLIWEVSESAKKQERCHQRDVLLIEQFKKELKSEREQVSHLNNLLEQKEGLLNKMEVEKKAYLGQIDGLTAELQDHKAKISQIPTNDPEPARPCPDCTEKKQQLIEKDQQLDHLNRQIRQFFEKVEKPAKLTPTPEATVPSCG